MSGDERNLGEKMAETARNLIRPNSNMMEILAGSSTHRQINKYQLQNGCELEDEPNLNKGITPPIK